MTTISAVPTAPAAVPHAKRPRILYMTPDGAPVGKQLDLVAAVAWKGGKYSTISANKILQPCLGYSTFIEGGVRFFPRPDVEEWLAINDATRPAYIRGLLERGTPLFRAYALETLEKSADRQRLPQEAREVYVELVRMARGLTA